MRKATPNMEVLFFHHIWNHPNMIERVNSKWFQKPEVKYLYRLLKEHWTNTEKKLSGEELFMTWEARDLKQELNRDAVKKIIVYEINPQITDDFIVEELSAWVIQNKFFDTMLTCSAKLADINETSIKVNELKDQLQEIQDLISNPAIIQPLYDEFLAYDFDDPDAHFQPLKADKIATGWELLDQYTGGGWAKGTLNVFAGMAGSGKSNWLCNCASNAIDDGKNVLYVTLELSEAMIIKRIGSKQLFIPMDKYDEASHDPHYMSDALENRKKRLSSKEMLLSDEKVLGKLWVRQFAPGEVSSTDIHLLADSIQKKYSKKIHLILVDYIGLMRPEASKIGKDSTLFIKGKVNAEGLRKIAVKNDSAVITASQIDKAQYGSNDMALADLSESKAIGDTADTVWGSIVTDQMKASKNYRLKCLKMRGETYRPEQITFDFDDRHMNIHNDRI